MSGGDPLTRARRKVAALEALVELAAMIGPADPRRRWERAGEVEKALRWYERRIQPLVNRGLREPRPGIEALCAAAVADPRLPRSRGKLHAVLVELAPHSRAPEAEVGPDSEYTYLEDPPCGQAHRRRPFRAG